MVSSYFLFTAANTRRKILHPVLHSGLGYHINNEKKILFVSGIVNYSDTGFYYLNDPH